MHADLIGAASASAVAVGGPGVLLALLVPMEAGVPIPVPADLVMFGVGAQVAAAVPGLRTVTVLAAGGPAGHSPPRPAVSRAVPGTRT